MNLIYILILTALLTCSVSAEIINYCDNPDIEGQWQKKIQKYSDIPEWKDLYLARKNLCIKVMDGDLSINQAIIEFENLRIKKVEQLKSRLIKARGHAEFLKG